MRRAGRALARLSALAVMLAAGAAMAGDPEAGERVFSVCRSCHAVGPEPPARMGPPLNGLFGRIAGTVEGYPYSDAMRESGIVWSPETLRAFLQDPQGAVPGTRMPGVLGDPDRIADLAAYLARFLADGGPAEP